MKNLTITEAEATELLILIRRELQALDNLTPIPGYEEHKQRRIDIMNILHDKLTSEEAEEW